VVSLIGRGCEKFSYESFGPVIFIQWITLNMETIWNLCETGKQLGAVNGCRGAPLGRIYSNQFDILPIRRELMRMR